MAIFPLCHCEPPVREAWQSRFLMEFIAISIPQNRRFLRLNSKAVRLAMTKVSIASFFAPRNDNKDDRELEGVSNVMELYSFLTLYFSYNIILNCGAWRSMGARLVWDQKVGGSNPLAPTRAGVAQRWSVSLPRRRSRVQIPSPAPFSRL